MQAPLTLLDSVKPEMELPIKVANKQVPAIVRAVVPVGEERSRQFELRIVLANGAFNVGTAIEVGLPERDAAQALVAPRDAIVVRQTNAPGRIAAAWSLAAPSTSAYALAVNQRRPESPLTFPPGCALLHKPQPREPSLVSPAPVQGRAAGDHLHPR